MRALSACPRFSSRLPSCKAAPAWSDCCGNNGGVLACPEITGASKSTATSDRLVTFFVKLISLPFQKCSHKKAQKFIYESDQVLRRESNEAMMPSSPATAAGRPSQVQSHATSPPAPPKSALDRTVLSCLF